MSVIETHLSDLRAGFGGYGFSTRLGMGSGSMLPLWRPTPAPAVSYCTSPTCPCSLPRPYLMSDMYDYPGFSYSWAAWYYKAAQDPGLYKGLPPLPPPSVERREIDHRHSPGKELPTKTHKQERMKKRVELSQTLHYDKDHALKHQQVCTGTQTPRSSVSPPHHYRTEESSSTESYSVYHHLLTQSVTSHQHLRNSPPQYAHSDLQNQHDAPLNLSITNSSANSSSSPQTRPSVITCAPVTANGRYENGSNRSPSPSGRREVNSADICDDDIEEHFRRSLGKNYTDFLAKPASTPSPPQPARLPSPPPRLPPPALPPPPPVALPPPPPLPPPPTLPPPPALQSLPTLPPLPPYHSVVPTLITNSVSGGKENPNVSISGSVDDHFARALGNRTWSELKAKNDIESSQPGSVDDHFAKALGDTWLKIKAEKESTRLNNSFPVSHKLPPHHSLPHPIPHPHPHVLPMSQRASPPTTQHSTSLLST